MMAGFRSSAGFTGDQWDGTRSGNQCSEGEELQELMPFYRFKQRLEVTECIYVPVF